MSFALQVQYHVKTETSSCHWIQTTRKLKWVSQRSATPLVDISTYSSALFKWFHAVRMSRLEWGHWQSTVWHAQGPGFSHHHWKHKILKREMFSPTCWYSPWVLILRDALPPLPCANMMGNQLWCIYYVLCNYIHCSEVISAPSGPGSLIHPGLERNPEAQGIDRPKIDPGHTRPSDSKANCLPYTISFRLRISLR